MKEVSAKEAYEIVQKDPETIYLDVRSVPEFEQGHPVRAINIPIMNFIPGMGMIPNPDFLQVAEANLPRDANILVGCKTGGRSARAVEMLSQLGYTKLANVRSGYVGAMDQTGRVVEPGWSMLDLPTCSACDDSAAYASMEAKSKK
jgi:rhodanese-related sulfurtransferase